jgi:hypothetical protein
MKTILSYRGSNDSGFDTVLPHHFTSEHGKLRMNQRGITEQMIEICFDYGEIFIQRNGGFAYIITDKAYARLLKNKNLKIDKKYLERMKGVVVIVSNDGVVITVYRNRNLHGLSHFSKN